MDLLSPAVAGYLEQLVPDRHPELVRMEDQARAIDFPIIGPVAGQFCYLVARLTGARRVFEMGSGFGYSTAWFARAVRENGGGTVDHVVWDEKLSARAREHLGAMDLTDVVRFTVGEAIATLREANGPFDLIFNDIEKSTYPDSLPVIHAKLKPGGVLIVDNMWWGGRIFDAEDGSAATAGVRELTRLLRSRPAWEMSLVPIRDGLIVARKQK
jgi:predicted O-methyltransferase YrrM